MAASALVPFVCVVHVWAPVVAVAVAPGPSSAVEPYVIVNADVVVRFETMIVFPASDSVPAEAVV